MSDGCINARADCPCSPGEVHYHTRNGIHVADEVTTAFFALREKLSAAERERDEARKSLREHSDVLYDLVKIIDGLDIRMSRRDSDAMSATLLLAEELLEERHED